MAKFRKLLMVCFIFTMCLSLVAIAQEAPQAGQGISQPGDGAKPSTTNLPNAQYPRVYPDGRVTFQLRAPSATKVQIQMAGATTVSEKLNQKV